MKSRNRLKSKIAATLFVLVLLASSIVAPAFGANSWQFGIEVRALNFDLYPNFLPQVSQIPAPLRTVPINSADPGAGTPIPIPNGTVEPGSFVPISGAIAPEVTYGRLTARAGVAFSRESGLPQPIEGSTGSTQEENYEGQGRTVGAALVYYSVLNRPSKTPGPFGEIELRARYGFSVLAGYQASSENVVLQQGWDRYDRLTVYQQTSLSHDLIQEPYGGIRWDGHVSRSWTAGAFIHVGSARISRNPTSEANGVVIGYRKSPYVISTGIDFQWDWHRRKSVVNGQ